MKITWHEHLNWRNRLMVDNISINGVRIEDCLLEELPARVGAELDRQRVVSKHHIYNREGD